MKKLICLFLTFIMVISTTVFGLTASAKASSIAVISSGNTYFNGSSEIKGDMIATGGTVGGRDTENPVKGVVYKSSTASVTNPNISVEDYTETVIDQVMPNYSDAPDASYFAGCEFSDGTKSVVVGWSGSEVANNYTISSDAYLNYLTVKSTLTLNILTNENQVRIIRVTNLNIYGDIKLTGKGKVIIYVDNFTSESNGNINANGSSDDLAFVFSKAAYNVSFNTLKKVRANVIVPNGNFTTNNVELYGNIYVGVNFAMSNSGSVNGYVFAPNSSTALTGSTSIVGQLVTKDLNLSGDCFVKYGSVSELPTDITDIILAVDTPVVTEKTVTIKVTVARRMSIRLEDGTVLKNGDSFTMTKGGTINFQICTNNWDTDSYDTNGNGIAGTKVYSFTDTSTDENALRTDTNKYFMAIRYHFNKGDYNKQTGIAQVLTTPLESLSVNLPLGAVISSDAYLNYSKVDSANVFVETAEDKTICYTDFYWEH